MAQSADFFMAELPDIGFPERVTRWRKRIGITQAEAAAILRVTTGYYNKLENGKKFPSKFLLEKFELLENEPMHSVRDLADESITRVREERGIAGGARSRPSIYNEKGRTFVRRIPLLGWAQAGEAVDFDTVVDWENVVSVEINDPKAIAVRIRGDSMAPRYVAGDIAVLAVSDPPRNDDLVIAKLKDEGIVFKKYQVVDPKKKIFRFISFNEQYAPIERTADQLVWIYPVDSIIQKLRR
jgi:phage repressor protein C with HTH and peptisase S24 domain